MSRYIKKAPRHGLLYLSTIDIQLKTNSDGDGELAQIPKDQLLDTMLFSGHVWCLGNIKIAHDIKVIFKGWHLYAVN